jgi:hypothetical protein
MESKLRIGNANRREDAKERTFNRRQGEGTVKGAR